MAEQSKATSDTNPMANTSQYCFLLKGEHDEETELKDRGDQRLTHWMTSILSVKLLLERDPPDETC